jgi:hypothetical protein
VDLYHSGSAGKGEVRISASKDQPQALNGVEVDQTP